MTVLPYLNVPSTYVSVFLSTEVHTLTDPNFQTNIGRSVTHLTHKHTHTRVRARTRTHTRTFVHRLRGE